MPPKFIDGMKVKVYDSVGNYLYDDKIENGDLVYSSYTLEAISLGMIHVEIIREAK